MRLILLEFKDFGRCGLQLVLTVSPGPKGHGLQIAAGYIGMEGKDPPNKRTAFSTRAAIL